DQWLGDLTLWKMFQMGGYPLIYSAIIVIYLATYFGILYWGIVPLVSAPFAALLASFFAFKLGLVHFILRPVVFSFPFFAAVTIILFRAYERIMHGKPLPAWIYAALPALFLLWANIHPSFVLGLVLIGTLLFGL